MVALLLVLITMIGRLELVKLIADCENAFSVFDDKIKKTRATNKIFFKRCSFLDCFKSLGGWLMLEVYYALSPKNPLGNDFHSSNYTFAKVIHFSASMDRYKLQKGFSHRIVIHLLKLKYRYFYALQDAFSC
jgi:hypothetical protein